MICMSRVTYRQTCLRVSTSAQLCLPHDTLGVLRDSVLLLRVATPSDGVRLIRWGSTDTDPMGYDCTMCNKSRLIIRIFKTDVNGVPDIL